MKYKLMYSFILLVLVSCNSETKEVYSGKCFIKYDSLFKKIDTTDLEINRNTDSAEIEVLDKKILNGERGILRFDKNKNLNYYAFLQNDHNDTDFFIRYDSVGNRKRSTNSEVVLWDFYKTKDSTIKFSFLLCAFDRNYGDIKIESGKFKKEKIVLFESSFIKLICACIIINRSDLDKNRKIYITGYWEDKCFELAKNFIDSTTVPSEL